MTIPADCSKQNRLCLGENLSGSSERKKKKKNNSIYIYNKTFQHN